ncbi:MAG: GIY-YIG nuclease family protein [Ruminococcus sp.]|nr:GIY-YIG nuclease family protein [Ruminococcus sp.]
MAISKKLEIIYHNGQPDGIRSIRRHLSTMTTYVVPRTLLSEAKKLSGINRPGIYYLISENDDNKIAQIYVGQTRNGVARLDDHNRSKDFWNKAIMFLDDNKTFSLDMISGLEAYAISKAHKSNRYKVENTVNPKYEIDEYDLPLIEEVYEEIKFIMATQGYKMENAKETLSEANKLHTTRNGITAFGVYDGECFEVLEGSQIDMSRKGRSPIVDQQRESAIKNGDIILKNGKYYLTISMSFTSPSSASCFVLGGSTNGWVEWKDKDGKSLDEIYRKSTK